MWAKREFRWVTPAGSSTVWNTESGRMEFSLKIVSICCIYSKNSVTMIVIDMYI